MNKFRTTSQGTTGPDFSQKSEKFLRRTVEFADGAYLWKPDPRHMQEYFEEPGLAGGKAPCTLGTKDTVKHVAEEEDSLLGVE